MDVRQTNIPRYTDRTCPEYILLVHICFQNWPFRWITNWCALGENFLLFLALLVTCNSLCRTEPLELSPSPLKCLLVLSLFNSYLRSYIGDIWWVYLQAKKGVLARKKNSLRQFKWVEHAQYKNRRVGFNQESEKWSYIKVD